MDNSYLNGSFVVVRPIDTSQCLVVSEALLIVASICIDDCETIVGLCNFSRTDFIWFSHGYGRRKNRE